MLIVDAIDSFDGSLWLVQNPYHSTLNTYGNVMSASQFRTLLVASIAVGIVAGGLDLVFPALVPNGFHDAQKVQDDAISSMGLLMIAVLIILAFVLLIASTYGLYKFRRWAPRLALVSTAVALLIGPFMGAFAQSGYSISLSYMASYLWGAVLVLIYVPPLNSKFNVN